MTDIALNDPIILGVLLLAGAGILMIFISVVSGSSSRKKKKSTEKEAKPFDRYEEGRKNRFAMAAMKRKEKQLEDRTKQTVHVERMQEVEKASLNVHKEQIKAREWIVEAREIRLSADGKILEAEKLRIYVEGRIVDARNIQLMAEGKVLDARKLEISAEGKIVNAEKIRVLAEGTVVNAEKIRVLAEGKVVDAQKIRVGAEAVLNEAKSKEIDAKMILLSAERKNVLTEQAKVILEREKLEVEHDKKVIEIKEYKAKIISMLQEMKTQKEDWDLKKKKDHLDLYSRELKHFRKTIDDTYTLQMRDLKLKEKLVATKAERLEVKKEMQHVQRLYKENQLLLRDIGTRKGELRLFEKNLDRKMQVISEGEDRMYMRGDYTTRTAYNRAGYYPTSPLIAENQFLRDKVEELRYALPHERK